MKDEIDIIKQIEQNETYIKILKDSFGGVCYMKKKTEYNIQDLKPLLIELKNLDLLDSINGIMKGVYNFLEVEK